MLDVFQQGLRKREPRVAVMLPARMKDGSTWVDAVIHNISSRGALIGSNQTPQTGTYVEIRRGSNILIGRVMWRKDRFFGVRTQDKIDLAALQRQPQRPGNRSHSATLPSDAERRSRDRVSRDGALARQVERNQELMRLFQFVFFGTAVAAGAVILAVGAFSMLRNPVEAIENALASRP